MVLRQVFSIGAALAVGTAIGALIMELEGDEAAHQAHVVEAGPAPRVRNLSSASRLGSLAESATEVTASVAPRPAPPPELAGLAALGQQALEPADADRRYLDAVRASGSTSAPWVRDAFAITDALQASFASTRQDAQLSDLECHAAGCTFTIRGSIASGDPTRELMSSEAISRWQGLKLALPVVDAGGRNQQRWILVRPNAS